MVMLVLLLTLVFSSITPAQGASNQRVIPRVANPQSLSEPPGIRFDPQSGSLQFPVMQDANGQHYVELYRGRTFLLVEKDAAGEWQITGYYTNTREDNIHAAELIEWVKYTNTNPIYSEPNDIARGLKVMAQAGFRVTVGTISIVVSELAHMIPEAAHYLLALAGLAEPTQQPDDDVVPRRRN